MISIDERKTYVLSKMDDIEALIGPSIKKYVDEIRDYVSSSHGVDYGDMGSIARYLRTKSRTHCHVLHHELLYKELIEDFQKHYE